MNVIIIGSMSGIVALCQPTGSPKRIARDTAILNNVTFGDRVLCYDANPPYWRVTNPEKHARDIPEIRRAIDLHTKTYKGKGK